MGETAGNTVTCISSKFVAPRLSIAVSQKRYVPATVRPLIVVARLFGLVKDTSASAGPKTLVQLVPTTVPSESEAVPVTETELVGRVIVLSRPALTMGGKLTGLAITKVSFSESSI